MRVGRPRGPIQAHVKVTDANGDPVPALDENDFTILIDGEPITIAADDVTLPPSLDPNQRVSVVFVMDYSASVVNQFRTEMEDAVNAFIAEMVDGDHAAVVKFNATNPNGASVVVPFTEIDDGGANDLALNAGVNSDYDGNGTNMADALLVALDHLSSPPSALPDGPKAIILIGDGSNNESTASIEDAIAQANTDVIPIFTIGIGEFRGSGPHCSPDQSRRGYGRRIFPGSGCRGHRQRIRHGRRAAEQRILDQHRERHHRLCRARNGSHRAGPDRDGELHAPDLRHGAGRVLVHVVDRSRAGNGRDLGHRDDRRASRCPRTSA